MNITHGVYLWEAICTQPDTIIQQEKGGWNELQVVRHSCIALRLRPQRAGFKPVIIDLHPETGFVLEWIGWENEITLAVQGGGPVGHSVTSKIWVRQYFEVPDEVGKRTTWFDFYYYVRPNGSVVVSTKDYDQMLVKMAGLLDGTTDNVFLR